MTDTNPTEGRPEMIKVFTQAFAFQHRGGKYTNAVTTVGKHRVEITVSPAQRNVHVHVNGERWVRAEEQL